MSGALSPRRLRFRAKIRLNGLAKIDSGPFSKRKNQQDQAWVLASRGTSRSERYLESPVTTHTRASHATAEQSRAQARTRRGAARNDRDHAAGQQRPASRVKADREVLIALAAIVDLLALLDASLPRVFAAHAIPFLGVAFAFDLEDDAGDDCAQTGDAQGHRQ